MINLVFTYNIQIKAGVIFTVLLLLLAITGYATDRTSTGNGDWDVAATWTPNGVPGNDDIITVAAGHTISVPVNAICKHLLISGTVNMTGTGITMDITNNNAAGVTNGLRLEAGSSLLIGATNTLLFSYTQASGIVNNGGTIVSTGVNGANGGTILAMTSSGGKFGVSGTGTTNINNLDFNANANFSMTGSGPVRINGTVSIRDNNWNANGSTQSPIYGPGSTLYISNNNQGISATASSALNASLSPMWAVSTGTIGVTPGYPNNVTIVKVGTSNGIINPPNVNVGWRPDVAIGLNGTLSIGDGTVATFVSLDKATSVNSGGITVNNGSTLIGPVAGTTFIDRGSFTLAGATTGVWFGLGATIDFRGPSSIGAPQIVSTTQASGSVTFPGVTISGNAYVRLDDPVNVTNTLTLTSGYVGSSAASPLNVTNPAIGAIVGGSATSYVNGPLTRALPGTTAGNYVFPVGDLVNNGGAYLPLTITSGNSAGGTAATATAFNINSNGIRDNTINTISPTEYWALSSTAPFTNGALVNLTRPTAVSPYNAIGKSTTSSGRYTATGGSPSGNSVNGGGTGSTNPVYLTLVNAYLNVVKIGGANAGVNSSCVATPGSLIVGGVGGTAPYEFSLGTDPFSTVNTFSPLAKGSYKVRVKDNTGTIITRYLTVAGAVQINGGNDTTVYCPTNAPNNTTLSATNLQNSSATYSWAPGGQTTPSIVVNPGVNTTYTVTSTVYANNIITNSSFEAGNPTGFSSNYTLNASAYGTTPGNNGYYSVGTSGQSQCTFFTTLAAQDGTKYFIGDGSIAPRDAMTLTIPGLSIGTEYRLSYWYAKGSNDLDPHIETFVDAVSLGSITINNYLGWTQANFTFTATATSHNIRLRTTDNVANTNGHDFYIDNIQLLAPCVIDAKIVVVPDCTLPVEYAYFKAEKEGKGALLTWATTNEVNTSHYVIERSLDGISFSPIGQVAAAGSSESLLTYSFADPMLSAGVTYYRIVQYDIDGNYSNSVIKSLSNDAAATIVIAPNPNNGIFDIIVSGTAKAKVSILNALGQVVYESTIDIERVLNVDLSNLASGVYYLNVRSNETTFVEKILTK